MSLFSQTSFWDIPRGPEITEELGKTSDQQVEQVDRMPMPDLTTDQLQDWTYRLQNMANEAGDGRLLALESDILDLRDEILFELHSRV